MKRILTVLLAVLCFSLVVGSTAFAGTLKSVYLKDGGVIECQNVWKTNGKIMVLVNRDVLLDFSRDEVDLKKTFGKKPAKIPAKIKKKGVKRQKIGAVRPPVQKKAIAQKPPARPIQEIDSSVQKPAMPVKPQAAPVAQAPNAPKPPVAGALKAVPAANPAVQGAATAAKKPVQPAKAVPKPAIQPAQPPAEPAFSLTSPLMLQAAGGGALIVLLVALLVMRRKKGK